MLNAKIIFLRMMILFSLPMGSIADLPFNKAYAETPDTYFSLAVQASILKQRELNKQGTVIEEDQDMQKNDQNNNNETDGPRHVIKMESENVLDTYKGPNKNEYLLQNTLCEQVYILLWLGYAKDSPEVSQVCIRYTDLETGRSEACPYCN